VTDQRLILIKGGATTEEVAAVVAVLQAASSVAPAAEKAPGSEWSSHARKVRPTHHNGPGGWRSSALPR
jgi:hypothetical protein